MSFTKKFLILLTRPAKDSRTLALKASILVVSVVVILNHFNFLEDLKINVIKLAMPVIFTDNPSLPYTYKHREEKGSAMVFTINDKLYEDTFKQASPLDRNELYEIIAAILKHKPGVLAIDLDLSPRPVKEFSKIYEENAQERLNRLLIENAKSTDIVLITPVKVRTEPLVEVKKQWMRMICDAQINFGLPYLYSRQGVVLRYLDNTNTFAWQIASVVDDNSKNERRFVKGKDRAICEQTDDELKKYISTRIEHKESGESKLLNLEFTDYIEPMGRARVETINKVGSELTGNVVFLGGSYGSTDKYETPAGPFAGVYIHGASLFSIFSSINKFNVVGKYVLEFGVCVLMGLLFYRLAAWYRNSRTILSVLINFGLPLILLVFLSMAAGYVLLSTGIWLNTTALIVGMEMLVQFEGAVEPIKNLAQGSEDSEKGIIVRINKFIDPEGEVKPGLDGRNYLSLLFFGGLVFYSWYLIAIQVLKY